jgi:hypothetical protein
VIWSAVMRLIQKIEIDPDDTIWKSQIKVNLGDLFHNGSVGMQSVISQNSFPLLC